jgi:hypothetical protein
VLSFLHHRKDQGHGEIQSSRLPNRRFGNIQSLAQTDSLIPQNGIDVFFCFQCIKLFFLEPKGRCYLFVLDEQQPHRNDDG